jgi:hypothetical protein
MVPNPAHQRITHTVRHLNPPLDLIRSVLMRQPRMMDTENLIGLLDVPQGTPCL